MSSSPTPHRRFHDLDALRSLLMIWGIAVHTSTLAPSPVFHEIARISGFIRMEAFFVISGLLSAMVLSRYGAGGALKRRLPAIALPLVAGLVLLNPITNYLIYCFHNPPISLAAFLSGGGSERPNGPVYWHLHLWFLFALLTYLAVSPMLARLIGFWAPAMERWSQRAHPFVLFLGIALAVPTACLASRVAFEFLVEPFTGGLTRFTVRSTFHYLPFFALGFVFYRVDRLLQVFARLHLGPALAAGVMLLAAHAVPSHWPKPLIESLHLLAETYFAVAAASILFHIARQLFANERPWVTACSSAAYSIYLFHFVTLYAIAWVLRPMLGEGHVFLITTALATFGTTLALHHYVIAPLPLLRLLFNGRPRKRAPSTNPDAPIPLLAPQPTEGSSLRISQP